MSTPLPIPLFPSLAAATAAAQTCPACDLSLSRQKVVFGEGPDSPPYLLLGEAPGRMEDETGRPFIGQSGTLLTSLLQEAGIARDEVYITSVLKCRPPHNRNPLPTEIASCRPWLANQLHHLSPRVIVTVGNFAAQTLLATKEGVTLLRERPHLYQEVPLVPTFHPAAVMRSRTKLTPPVLADLERARSLASLPRTP